MPSAETDGPISSLGGQPIRPAEQRRNHEFTGSTTETLSAAIDLDLEAGQDGDEIAVTARVTNAGAGHDFPTGISIRNALLVIEARRDGELLDQVFGDTIPFYGSAEATDTDDDLAGHPGKGFARVLEGRINGQGPVVRPVLFIDAEGVWADTRIPSGETDTSEYRFAIGEAPGNGTVEVSARLLYRRAWRDTVVTKGWTTTPAGGPIEIEVDARATEVEISGAPGPGPELPSIPVPTLNQWALLVLAFALLLIGQAIIRRT